MGQNAWFPLLICPSQHPPTASPSCTDCSCFQLLFDETVVFVLMATICYDNNKSHRMADLFYCDTASINSPMVFFYDAFGESNPKYNTSCKRSNSFFFYLSKYNQTYLMEV